jgi:hypothetical protein
MKLKILLIALLICGVAYAAECSYNAYADACHVCPVNEFGKMNQECYNVKQGDGEACIAEYYPILAANYKAGKCPQVDTCASELQSCKNRYASGNDSVDCNNSQIASCFKQSDQCVEKAVNDCGDSVDLTGCPFVGILSVVLLGAVYAERIAK